MKSNCAPNGRGSGQVTS